MGAVKSKKSVDITTTPKKDVAPVDGAGAAVETLGEPGDGKLEKIEETDTKPTGNGTLVHTDKSELEEDKTEVSEKAEDKAQDGAKDEETKVEASGEAPSESAEQATSPVRESSSPVTSPESKEPKKKDKSKKKWLRSISFSKKDKNKPTREETPKNGDVAKEATLVETNEEIGEAATVAGSSSSSSPAEEKSEVSSPSTVEAEAVTPPKKEEESKEDEKAEVKEVSKEKKQEAAAVEKVENAQKEVKENPMENKPVENGMTDVVEKVCPLPPVASPTPAPAITEDVASVAFVTKAVEEFDIHDKDVAAAVSSAIESSTTDIVADAPMNGIQD